MKQNTIIVVLVLLVLLFAGAIHAENSPSVVYLPQVFVAVPQAATLTATPTTPAHTTRTPAPCFTMAPIGQPICPK